MAQDKFKLHVLAPYCITGIVGHWVALHLNIQKISATEIQISVEILDSLGSHSVDETNIASLRRALENCLPTYSVVIEDQKIVFTGKQFDGHSFGAYAVQAIEHLLERPDAERVREYNATYI